MFDYHVHTTFSVDCTTPIDDSCRAAIANGITEIAFTDHVDHQPADMGYGFYRPEEYLAEIDRVRDLYGRDLTILAGIEVDYHDDTRPVVEQFMNEWADRYDFVIGSVHYGHAGEIIFPEYFAGKTQDEVFLPYFDQIERAVRTGWFNTIGHLDIPKRYLPGDNRDYDPGRYRDRLMELFRVFIETDTAFEINTSGIRQRPKTSMPGPAIVRWYVEAGGTRITTGTDSHAAQTVGAGVQTTLAMLSLCGISSVWSFRNRVGTPVPIDTLAPAR
ncbi:MAG: histidinol-phosphatase HisJ family protein [Chloroflexota bacterium]|nr:histidinol-phosphatase HisJ family protein [Chloroflexota bacterium]